MNWLRLRIPCFEKWYNWWYYRIFHPEIAKWRKEVEQFVQEKTDKVLEKADWNELFITGRTEILIEDFD